MLIPLDDASLFFNLYTTVIGYVCGRSGDVAGIKDRATWEAAPIEARAKARDYFLDHIDQVSDFVESNPEGLEDEHLVQVAAWRRFVQGNFYVERDLKKYTVFLDAGEPPSGFAVLGLTTEIMDMLPTPLPAYVSAVLLPWRDVVVCDGLIGGYNLIAGGGIKRMLRDTYRRVKAAGMIITYLDRDWSPLVARPKRRPKTPAIQRFMRKKCPETVEELVEAFGQPRMEMGGEAAKEYSVWGADGQAMYDVDQVLLYANIIKDQVLYIYAREGRITHVSVVDPTDWRKKDFRPGGGRRLMR